ncbi:aminomethyltransferase, putative [Plasmodium gaboni]|uniref:Aminomethyltransferase, putative n=1 Tax=Plasmodium gaboni TaxID=647221 RepID=A0ABY1UTF6_9APIC|nr:aminomethyltransferase, putative [Plasmodium gaboni]
MQKYISHFVNEFCHYKIKDSRSLFHQFYFPSFFDDLFIQKSKRRFGTYGAVTRKRQELREKFYEEKYKHNPNHVPKYSKVKKGSRGGWIKNPLKEVTKNSGNNFKYEEKIKEEISSSEEECIKKMIQMRKEVSNKRIVDEDYNELINNDYKNINISNNISNFNLFSICDNFIDKKKEIIHKIENPQHFVDKHIKNLVDTYSNINELHENYNANNMYPKTPDYLKDIHNKKNKKKKEKNQINGNGKENENNLIDLKMEHNCIMNKNVKENEDYLNCYNEESSNCYVDNTLSNSNNNIHVDKPLFNSFIETEKLNKQHVIPLPLEEESNNDENNVIEKFECDSNNDNIKNVHMNEHDWKKLYIEDLLNYTDENDIDIGCLDIFTTLSTIDRNRKLGAYFSKNNASFILYNNCIIPSKYKEGTLNEYLHTRNKCSLFDKSYQLILKLSGNDCFYICNQFISSDIYDINNYDAFYTCIIDNKAYILDTCYVLKTEKDITLITSGYYKKGLYEFLSDYILFCKDSGMDVHIQVDINKRILSLQGPLSNMIFNDILEYYDWNNKDRSIRYLNNVIINKHNNNNNNNNKNDIEKICTDVNTLYFKNEDNNPIKSSYFQIPYMSFKKFNVIKNGVILNDNKQNINKSLDIYEIICIRIGDTGEDGYEFIVDNNISNLFVDMFLNHKNVKLAGAYALDILRMESGFPLYGTDIIKNTSPITASLAWTLKYKKIKEKSIFGFQNLLKEYSMKPKFLRVGILSNQLIFKTCKILSYPYKKPIGYITSCTWSPIYKKRIAQGYIRRDFAKNNEQVLISIPTDIPQDFSKKKKYKILRSRSAHKFTLAQVCALPFVEHKYQKI